MGIYYSIVNVDASEIIYPGAFGGSIKQPLSNPMVAKIVSDLLTNYPNEAFNHYRGRWAGDRVVMEGDLELTMSPPVEIKLLETFKDISSELFMHYREDFLEQLIVSAHWQLECSFLSWKEDIEYGAHNVSHEYSAPDKDDFLELMLPGVELPSPVSDSSKQAWDILACHYVFSDDLRKEKNTI